MHYPYIYIYYPYYIPTIKSHDFPCLDQNPPPASCQVALWTGCLRSCWDPANQPLLPAIWRLLPPGNLTIFYWTWPIYSWHLALKNGQWLSMMEDEFELFQLHQENDCVPSGYETWLAGQSSICRDFPDSRTIIYIYIYQYIYITIYIYIYIQNKILA